MLTKAEFKELFDQYFDTIRCFIFYRCGDTDAASDIAQDVFMKVWEKREQLSNNKMKSLLYKMSNDAVISDFRKNTNHHDIEKSMILHKENALSPEDELSYKELLSSYARALSKMPETQRVVFLMSRNDDLKYGEIAAYLNISVKAVEKRMSAALQFLRNELLEP